MMQKYVWLIFLPFSFCQNLVIFDDFENLEVSNSTWVDNGDWEITDNAEFVPVWKTMTLKFKETSDEVESRSLCTKQAINNFNCVFLRIEVKIPSNLFTNSDRLKIEVMDSVDGSRVVLHSFGGTPLLSWFNFTMVSENIPLRQYHFCVTGNYSTFRQEILISRLYASFTNKDIGSTGVFNISSMSTETSSIFPDTTRSSRTPEGTRTITMSVLPTTGETGTSGEPPQDPSILIGLAIFILVLSVIIIFLVVAIILTLKRKQNKLEEVIETINRSRKKEEYCEPIPQATPHEIKVPVCYSNQARLAEIN